jgi:hypothetical protein
VAASAESAENTALSLQSLVRKFQANLKAKGGHKVAKNGEGHSHIRRAPLRERVTCIGMGGGRGNWAT